MEPETDSYLAWDGARYPAPPPEDWFLAIDGRWWPSPELIDGHNDAEAGSTAENRPNPEAQSPFPTPTPNADPLDSAPPRPADVFGGAPAPAPSSPGLGGPGTPGQTQGPRKKKRGNRIFFFILVFGGIRLISQLSDDNNATPPVEVATTLELAEPQADGTRFSTTTTDLAILSCGPDSLAATLQNKRLETALVDLEIRIVRDPETISENLGTVEEVPPFQRIEIDIELPTEMAPGGSCEVVEVWIASS